MNKESKDFLYRLLKTPSLPGFEEPIQRVVKNHMKKYADSIETDLHGNLMVSINPKAKKRVMLAGHCDQIGFLVRHISESGFIYFDNLGGIDQTTLYGSTVEIHNKRGKITGVIGKKAIHHEKPEERARPRLDSKNMWIDIGAKDKKAAEKLVSIADPITYKLGVTELADGMIASPGLDDKVGLFIAMEALRLCSRGKLNVGLYAVSTVQEEVGLRGARTSAYTIDPEVGIAIDVTHASDDPATSGKKVPPCKLGAGPGIYLGPSVNPVVHRRLVDAAKKSRIPHQVLPHTNLLGNDATAIQVARGAIASGSIGVPNRNMHTQVEVCHFKDLENSAKLLAAFVKNIGERTDFRPK